jgi:TRAP-type transport system periplasmic protein
MRITDKCLKQYFLHVNQRRIKIRFGVFCLFFILSIGMYGQVIKLGTLAPKGSPWYNALKKAAQEWRELSNGKIKIRIYPGGVAGDDSDMIRKMRIGQLHAAAITTSGMAYIYLYITALTFPNNIKTDAELKHVIKKVGPHYEEQVLKKGFKILTWGNAGWVHFFSKTPVVTPDDMKKQKLFFWGSAPIYVKALKNAGFNPIPLSFTDLLPSLQTGLVTAFVASPQTALAFQWYQQAPNMCGLRWQPLPAMVVISKKKWMQLPAELRPALAKSMAKLGAKLWVKIIELENDSLNAMKKHGLKVNPVPPEVMTQWQNLIKEKAFPVFVGHRFSRSTFDRIQAALKEYRAQKAKIKNGKKLDSVTKVKK